MADKLSTMQRPSTATHKKFEMSRRAMRSESGGFYANINNRPATPIQNILSRPPSTSVLFNPIRAGSSRLTTTSSSSAHLNTGLSMAGVNVTERPITQHGVAGVRPGTCRGLSMTRQIQDKRYYIGVMQLKIRELNQEISTITRDIEDQNKERATYLHYDKRAKDLAVELTALQGQLADYNIVVDKMTSNIGKDVIEQETEELASKNEQSLSKIENMFEERKQLEQQLSKTEKQLENEKKRTERLVESMNSSTREKYDKLLKERASLQEKANKMQQQLDELYKEQVTLEEEIALSPLKQEAVKLHLKIIETEEKRGKLQEEEKHRISPEEEKEKLLQKIKQHNMDIAAAEALLVEKKKRIQEIEQKLEQLETDIEDTQSEKQIKYKELRKREEIMEQFMSSFEQNKQNEMKKLHGLEETVVENLKNISNMLEIDIDFVGGDEITMLNSIPSYDEYQHGKDQSLEGLTKENLKLQQILSKMEMLEQRLKVEFADFDKKMSKNENKVMVLEDLDSLKNKLATKEEQLTIKLKELKEQSLKHEQDLKENQLEYNNMKEKLEHNKVYTEINVLQNTVEKLAEEHGKIKGLIADQRKRGNYGPVKENALDSLINYNTMLKENLKIIY
ncbi:intraflagellar transport protein 74 homolog isoform X1 [Hylaeus volcanicus]|uniref:intraflagellar transport protein 74 homolog isoform X1 n=1 Tax=Hylaeus volcanicus TaxID=313075 RepID=UPI0023B8358E|nr:intraflagellar transport protein 74 homolog isoform X1 [Hylaeus volcanicus]